MRNFCNAKLGKFTKFLLRTLSYRGDYPIHPRKNQTYPNEFFYFNIIKLEQVKRSHIWLNEWLCLCLSIQDARWKASEAKIWFNWKSSFLNFKIRIGPKIINFYGLILKKDLFFCSKETHFLNQVIQKLREETFLEVGNPKLPGELKRNQFLKLKLPF